MLLKLCEDSPFNKLVVLLKTKFSTSSVNTWVVSFLSSFHNILNYFGLSTRRRR